MYNGSLLLVWAGVLLVIAVVAGMVYVIREPATTEKQRLLSAIMYSFAVVLGVWLVDKVSSSDTQLLSREESSSLFSLVKDVMLLVFGYYFGKSSGGDTR
jgi:predicted membrane channel-forming protein YqfA (hemolysin III family)